MNKLDGLDFSNANNACLSLRTLAEWVRAGEIKLFSKDDWETKEPDLTLGFKEPGAQR